MCLNFEKVFFRNFFLIYFVFVIVSILDVEWFVFCKLDIILLDVCKFCYEVFLLIVFVLNFIKFWLNVKYLYLFWVDKGYVICF